MTIKEYQQKTKEFACYPTEPFSWTYPVIALGEEAGEVQGKFAKAFRDDGGIITETRKEEIKKELGDVCWELSQICNELDFDLEQILELNIKKLTDRKNRNVIHGAGDNR